MENVKNMKLSMLWSFVILVLMHFPTYILFNIGLLPGISQGVMLAMLALWLQSRYIISIFLIAFSFSRFFIRRKYMLRVPISAVISFAAIYLGNLNNTDVGLLTLRVIIVWLVSFSAFHALLFIFDKRSNVCRSAK